MLSSNSASELPYREITIPVPWGHIAGKEWGNTGGHRVLGIHGWQDNCGTFDLVAPHLPKHLHFVAIDLPGHGFSSHIPSGFFYDMVSYVSYIRRVILHLKWDDFSILGHSLGAMVGLGYSSCYPTELRKLVCLDVIRPYMMPLSSLPSFVAKRLDQMIKYEAMGSTKDDAPRSYDVDELIPKLLESTEDFMTEESARILLKRGTRPVDGSRVVLTRDRKLRFSLPIATDEQLWVLGENLRCDLLLVLASNGIRRRYFKDLVEETLDTYKKNTRTFKVVEVEGTHHVHLNNPERVIPILQDYFSNN